jgi:stage V sporulation protein D (sporulation-specific penicillin-binding protein)
MIGGKTGTAETVPRNKKDYVVSFMGYAPAKDPQIAIYVVVDRPNVVIQDDAKFATGIVRNVLTEVMPYLGFPMTEALSDDEKAELAKLKEASVTTASMASSGDSSSASSAGVSSGNSASSSSASSDAGTAKTANEIWKTFDVDPSTGYYIDPNTGNLIDPETGDVVNGSVMSGIDGSSDSASAASGNGAAGASDKQR